MRALVLSAAALLCLSGVAGAVDLRSQTKSYPAAEYHSLLLDLAAGEVAVEGSDDDHVRITVTVHCDDMDEDACQRRARHVDLDATRNGDQLDLTVANDHGWRNTRSHLRIEVQVPRSLAVELKFKAGELQVTDLGRDVHVTMGAGEARLRLRESDVGSVRAYVGVGETRLHTHAATYEGDGFISRSLRWTDGRGPSQVRVTLGAGEVDLRLE